MVFDKYWPDIGTIADFHLSNILKAFSKRYKSLGKFLRTGLPKKLSKKEKKTNKKSWNIFKGLQEFYNANGKIKASEIKGIVKSIVERKNKGDS